MKVVHPSEDSQPPRWRWVSILALLLAMPIVIAGCGDQPSGAVNTLGASVAASATTETGEPSVPESSSPGPAPSSPAPSTVPGTASSALTITPSMVSSFTATSGVVPPAGAPRTGAVVELVGHAEEGVEAGCVVLLDTAGRVLANLMGQPTSNYSFGTRVRVTGRFVKGVMTTCQQGQPFQVESMTPIG